VIGRKWSATETVSQAESALKHNDIVGMTGVGRQGIGATNTLLWSQAVQNERRAMIQAEVRRTEESRRQVRAVDKSMDHMGYDRQKADLWGRLKVRTTEAVLPPQVFP